MKVNKDLFFASNGDARIYESMPHIRMSTDSVNVLEPYPEILEFAKQRFIKVLPDSLQLHTNQGIEICYIHKGRYNWVVEDKTYTLYPGDAFITCPWEKHGSPVGFLDLGLLSWIIITPGYFDNTGELRINAHSGIDPDTQKLIGRILTNKKHHSFNGKNIKNIFSRLHNELYNPSLGSKCIIYQLIDSLLIDSARKLQEKNDRKPEEFDLNGLTDILQGELGDKWTIEDMAQRVSLPPNILIERCKSVTGLTPIQLLTELRIKRSINMMRESDLSITKIAYDCGFSSIQYFSETFKKRIGYSPKQYKERLLTKY